MPSASTASRHAMRDMMLSSSGTIAFSVTVGQAHSATSVGCKASLLKTRTLFMTQLLPSNLTRFVSTDLGFQAGKNTTYFLPLLGSCCRSLYMCSDSALQCSVTSVLLFSFTVTSLLLVGRSTVHNKFLEPNE